MGLSPSESFPEESYFQEQQTPSAFSQHEDCQDPFSDLSLFISGKMKQEIKKLPNSKQLSASLSQRLVGEIISDLKKQFPKYNLGNTYLKSAWSKVQHYLELVAHQKHLFDQEGKLCIPSLISENLKQRALQKTLPSQEEQMNEAQKIALSISECVATVDQVKPDISFITKITWMMQSHLIPKNQWMKKSPFQIDIIDRFITKWMLEEGALTSGKDHKDVIEGTSLYLSAYEKIKSLTPTVLREHLCSLYSQSLVLQLPLKKRLGNEAYLQLCYFLESQAKIRNDMDRLTLGLKALFTLAASHQKDLVKAQLKASVQAIEGNLPNILSPYCPLLNEQIYAYIQSELSFLKASKSSKPMEKVLKHLFDLFDLICKLPPLLAGELESLEILIWSGKKDLPPLDSHVEKTLLFELAQNAIQNPKDSFLSIVQATAKQIKKICQLDFTTPSYIDPFIQNSTLAPSEHLYKKIYAQAIQGELLFKSVYLDHDDYYFKMICKKWKQLKLEEGSVDHEGFVTYLTDSCLKEFPSLKSFRHRLRQRILITYKVFWFQELCSEKQSSMDRLTLWKKATS